jgi:hypothetical protein
MLATVVNLAHRPDTGDDDRRQKPQSCLHGQNTQWSIKMPQQEVKKPNILFFHVDNISVGDFGCCGGADPIGAKTPHTDRFAGERLLLTNYNVEAQCTPSRSALSRSTCGSR